MAAPSRGCIFYTDDRVSTKIANAVQSQLMKATPLKFTSVSLRQPTKLRGLGYILKEQRGYLTMMKQILTALNMLDTDIVYFCEHDVLYPKEHFDFIPPDKDKFYYDDYWYKTRKDGFAVSWRAVQVSGLVCYRDLAIDWYTKRIETFDEATFDRKFEPTVNTKYETFRSAIPMVDIRHDHNLTYNKWHIQHFRDKSTAIDFQETTIEQIPGWSLTAKDIYG